MARLYKYRIRNQSWNGLFIFLNHSELLRTVTVALGNIRTSAVCTAADCPASLTLP